MNRKYLWGLLLIATMAVACQPDTDDTGTPTGAQPGLPQDAEDGATAEVATAAAGFLVYDAYHAEWVEPEAFWERFANRTGGYTWDSSREYPEYDEVNEHDTFLVQTDAGPCLMYFHHERWRCAADVWSWGAHLGEYAGCKSVFD